MKIGDLVVRKSYDMDITFKIMDIKEEEGEKKYILKGISIRIIADSKEDDLEEVKENYVGEQEKILNSRVKSAINRAISVRKDVLSSRGKSSKIEVKK